jgi:hypothetical protein
MVGLTALPGRYEGRFEGISVSSHPDFGTSVRWDFTIAEGRFAGSTVSRTTNEYDRKTDLDVQLLNMVSAFTVTSLTYELVKKAVGKCGTVVVGWLGYHDVQVSEFIVDGDD